MKAFYGALSFFFLAALVVNALGDSVDYGSEEDLPKIADPDLIVDDQIDTVSSRMATEVTGGGISCENNPFSLDGSCNNIEKPNLGKHNTVFNSLFKPWKINPNDIDLPSPRLVSNIISHEEVSPPNRRHLSEFFTFFGQFLDHTIAETHPTKVRADIPVPADDKFLAPGGIIEFNTTAKIKKDGVEIPENIISSFVDGSAIYGHTKNLSKSLRLWKKGYLKTSAGKLLPLNNNMHFMAGDVRVNENPALQSMHTLWVREHNRVADEILEHYPGKPDEWVFDLARRVVVAEFQQVVFHEFVPAMLGRKLPEYLGYQKDQDSSTSNEFATVAYRVGHTLVNEFLTVYYEHGKQVKKKLSEVFFQTKFVREYGISGIIQGILGTTAAEVDVGVTTALRSNLFPDAPAGASDLVSLNLMRARDHGIPPYNHLRQLYGLRKLKYFYQITKNKNVAKKLEDVYAGDINKVDPWIGGLAEDHYGKSSLGELFYTMWIAEFGRMRDGNRIYYEYGEYAKSMPVDIKTKIKTWQKIWFEHKHGGTMKRIIELNTKIPVAKIQNNPFFTHAHKFVHKKSI